MRSYWFLCSPNPHALPSGGVAAEYTAVPRLCGTTPSTQAGQARKDTTEYTKTIEQQLDEHLIDVRLAIEEVVRPYVVQWQRLALHRQALSGRPAPALVIRIEP